MTILYRAAAGASSESDHGEAVQEALEEMVIEHDVVSVASDSPLPNALSMEDLPVLVDDGTSYIEPAAIRQRLDELRTLMADWNRFQSDTCHIDDDGTVCGPYDVDNMDGPGVSAKPFRQGTTSAD